eukprot:TRINITY_DN81999_c0_g1_i1.p1 TRINITY_DN81999_c0_g1~~TRINITY_DN81999_c0_g1_i1.p1  ORF type:complete len:321 (-),score=53.67 TRINITY_DN81999_c0_g1_i1:98-1060(-)
MTGQNDPLQKGMGPGYGGLPRPVPSHKKPAPVDMDRLVKAGINIGLPPLMFGYVTSILTFKTHFFLGGGIWWMVALSLAPIYISYRMMRWSMQYKLNASWSRLSVILFFLASFVGSSFGTYNYWYYAEPSYALEGLRVYKEIDTMETSGARVMDASRIDFLEGTTVMTDMAMSYTDHETYCVAPIASNVAKEGGLSSYDFWAVGVGCCSPGQSNFHCGAYNKQKAHSGLRMTANDQLPYFQLAVQQAEAAYNLQPGHTIFLYWTEDAADGAGEFFAIALKNWIMANIIYTGINLVFVFAFIVVVGGGATKDTGLSVLDDE